ncbi:hypothetical protein EH105704_06_00185 [Atlantibacter hermannii NBRC 105704]|uniref:Uncharacterized protein n=1 Tax=Atlantibacter hermannii NBRC 105704 TaxID=1115512 RepID=H5V316_ATLHE|nr:hypothetical protein EH105704_06_00185 [Atlantibacter hermannii NBRC 105704]
MLFLLFLPPGLQAGQTACLSITLRHAKTTGSCFKTTGYYAGWLSVQEFPETWRQYRLFTKSLQLTYIQFVGF